MYRYKMMILITEGENKGLYYSRRVRDVHELADIYENEFDIIKKCDYILDYNTGNYLSAFDKDRIIASATMIAKRDPFGYKY